MLNHGNSMESTGETNWEIVLISPGFALFGIVSTILVYSYQFASSATWQSIEEGERGPQDGNKEPAPSATHQSIEEGE